MRASFSSGRRPFGTSQTGKIKSKTGCITCRIRRVKCDQGKPACTRCLSTDRKCDGYQSNFRIFNTSEATFFIPAPVNPLWSVPASSLVAPGISPQAVMELSRQFTIKPIAFLDINYEAEARASLNAISEPAVHHALASLGVLRKLYDQFGSVWRVPKPSTAGFSHGVQEYAYAVGRLANKLSTETAVSIKVALLCCQIFISIEVVLSDIVSATHHFIHGIRIMHQYRTRQCISDTGRVYCARFSDMPSLDIFFIKLLAPPCPGEQHVKIRNQSPQAEERTGGPPDFEKFIPLAGAHISDMANVTIDVLMKMSQLSLTSPNHEVAAERRHIVQQIEQWEDASRIRKYMERRDIPDMLRIKAGFTVFRHLVIKIVMVLSLPHPLVDAATMESEFNKLIELCQYLADIIQPRAEN